MPNRPRAALNADGTCTKCGQLHPKCAAHNAKGLPCGTAPMRGQDVCRRHGGASPQARVAARRRLAADEAQRATRRLFDQYDVDPVDDPVELFQTIVAEARTMQLFLADRTADLEAQITGKSHEGYEYLRAVLVEYRKATMDCAKLLEVWMRLDLDERLVRVRESQAVLVGDALVATLRTLNIDIDDEQVRSTLASNLRVIDGGLSA